MDLYNFECNKSESASYLASVKDSSAVSNLQKEIDELILNLGEEDEESPSEDEVESSENDDDDMCLSDLESSFKETAAFQNQSTQENFLTLNEQEVICKCEDPQLKQLLKINRLKAFQLSKICKSYHRAIERIDELMQSDYQDARTEIGNLKSNKVFKLKKNTRKIGMPYFKIQNDVAPVSIDYEKMKERGEQLCKGGGIGRWTSDEIHAVIDAIRLDYFDYRTKVLCQKIAYLNFQITNEPCKEKVNELKETLKELIEQKQSLDLENPKAVPPLDDQEYHINWEEISQITTKRKRTPIECRNIWRCYIHPDINKSKWSLKESNEVRRLLSLYGNDWERIAKELGTNRTGHMVFVHFKSKLEVINKPRRFTLQEDETILNAVKKYQFGDYIPWHRISLFFPDREEYTLYHRYRYYLAPKNVKKGAWNEKEDILLMALIKKFGLDYSKIANLFPKRTITQLRYRYKYLDRMGSNIKPYSVEDDVEILNHSKNNPGSWVTLAKKQNRTGAHIRQRYLTLLHAMQKNPDLTVDLVPRRTQYVLPAVQQPKCTRMQQCLGVLENVDMPNLQTVELLLESIVDTSEEQPLEVGSISRTYHMQLDQDEHIINQQNVDTEAINRAAKGIFSLTNAFSGNCDFFEDLLVETADYLTVIERAIIYNIAKACKIIELQNLEVSLKLTTKQFCLPPNLTCITVLKVILFLYQIYVKKHLEESKETACIDILKATLKQYFVPSDTKIDVDETTAKKIRALKKKDCEKIQKKDKTEEPPVVSTVDHQPCQKKKAGRPRMAVQTHKCELPKKGRGRPTLKTKEFEVLCIPKKTHVKNPNDNRFTYRNKSVDNPNINVIARSDNKVTENMNNLKGTTNRQGGCSGLSWENRISYQNKVSGFDPKRALITYSRKRQTVNTNYEKDSKKQCIDSKI